MAAMSKSMSLFRLFGIPVRIHWTWFCFPFAVFIGGGWMLDRWTGAIVAFSLLCLAVGSGLVHELAHCLTARVFGCGTGRILLIPFGIVADLNRIPREPAHEILMAAAGPLTSACLAGVAWAGSLLARELHTPIGFHMIEVLYFLLAFNSMVAGFNLLLVILPTDGGRILRATIFAALRRWSRLTDRGAHLLATKIAVRFVGWPLAVIVLVAQVKTGFWLPHLWILLPLLGVAGEAELWALRECPEIFDVPDTVTFLPRPPRWNPGERCSPATQSTSLWGMEVVVSSERDARWVT